ncbi:MAG: SpoIIIAC/SpoIIIAD family protein, partial [Clostridia bacterium]
MGVAILALAIILVLKEQRPEMALMLTIVTGVVLLIFTITKMSGIVDMLNELVSKSGMNKEFLEVILKVT